ncbi:hypothetical protein OUZ56_013530 [Daphnia magna]|uniref:Uncharacterized protein n=1 Tax=Daphnia magna TaxID=35525 RepID=A0ABQ9Z661_9CRUS|nr:hypothetical protein OUZ56_013530 [Daphnia magna]
MEGRGERIQSETNNKRKREKEEEQKAQNTVNESGMEERTDKRKRKRRGPPDDGCRRFQALTYIPSACKLLPSSSLCSASFGGPNSVYFKPPPLKKSALT